MPLRVFDRKKRELKKVGRRKCAAVGKQPRMQDCVALPCRCARRFVIENHLSALKRQDFFLLAISIINEKLTLVIRHSELDTN